MAFSSLRAHKMRSILTMLGIIIGVGSVITVVAVGQGGEAVLKSQFTGESNTIDLFYQPSDEEIEQDSSILSQDAFTSDDISLIEKIPEVGKVAATSSESASIRHVEENSEAMVMGINHAYLDVQGLDISEGRNLLAADFLAGSRVAVVSESLKEDVLEGEDEELLGKFIYVKEQPVEIVGTIEKEGSIFDLSSDMVYVPMITWQNIFLQNSITGVSIQSSDADELQTAGEKAADLLNKVHDTDDAYQVLNMEEMAEGIGKITRVMTIIISSI